VKVHHTFERADDGGRPLVLAIGFFDGFHRGHREIVRALLRLRRPGYRAAILTFRNHPATHLRPEHVPLLLTTTEERVDLLAATGIDELFLVPFDERIALLSARRFLEEILVDEIGVRALVVGENFRFGAGRQGDASLASEVLRERGVDVYAVPPLLDGDERISSTRIRTALERGDFTTVDRLLGQPYAVRGRVVLGAGRGHDLGFPTANLAVSAEKMLPRDGVYRIAARHDGTTYRGLVSIGDNPTFVPGAKTVEAWLQDFHATIYGHELLLSGFHFIREQRTFGSAGELVAQMHEDATHVRFPSFPTL
jgi:riboflavin kinase / FMN adenylyltransferase